MHLSIEAKKYFAAAGRKGGQARAHKMSAKERKALAKRAAQARWLRRKSLQEAILILDSAKCGSILYSEHLYNAARYLEIEARGSRSAGSSAMRTRRRP